MANGVTVNPSNPGQLNFDGFKGIMFDLYNFNTNTRDLRAVLTDDLSTVPNDYAGISREAFPKEGPCESAGAYIAYASALRYSIEYTNGNLPLALTMYNAGKPNFDKVLAYASEKSGLTAAEIFANYGPEFLAEYDTEGLIDPEYYKAVLSYVDGPIVIKNLDENEQVLDITYTVEAVKQ